jgi:uncharacterized protein YbjT (DUF2867 family)
VTILARTGSQSTFPAEVAAVHRVDFGSADSLTAALHGQDAVFSTMGAEGLADQQRVLADAAVAVGVRRFSAPAPRLKKPCRVSDGNIC